MTSTSEKEEFELIPVSPLRKLEKRIEQIESAATVDDREFYKEMVDIIRMNQQLVDELAKANDALRIELSRLPARLEELVSRLDELISFIKASATEEVPATVESVKPLTDKMDQLIETNKKLIENNQAILATLDEIGKKLTRPPLPPMKKPVLFPPKPI